MAGFDNDVVYGINADYSNTLNGTGASTVGQLLTNSQLWIGATAANAGGTHINVGTLTSPDSSITVGYTSPNITLQVTGGSTSVVTLTGNSGVATPSAGNINVITANTTVKFVGSGSTLTQDFGLTNLLLGDNGSAITSGIHNIGIGFQTLSSLIGASNNVGIGYQSLRNVTSGNSNVCMGTIAGETITTGASNVLLGFESGFNLTTSIGNVAIGSGSLLNFSTGAANAGANISIGTSSCNNLATGINNTTCGDNSLKTITTGSYNIAYGFEAGKSLSAADSSNIDIGNSGTSGDSNTIRIGTQGSGNGQQLQTYIAGVINTVSGRVVKTTSPGAYPYTTLTTDYVILVDTSSARTIVPLAAPVTGTTYRIKDSVGSAAANNITITPSGKNIDGVASYVINGAYGSVDIVYNGTEWNRF